MCGIVGFQTRHRFGPLQDALPGAVASLAHRGPDDSGLSFRPEVGLGLGQTRLSILDLTAAGHQPMTLREGDLEIVYNGEIYNFREIRKTLQAMGHVFHTQTDTEVLLHAYRRWGIPALERFVGMFAFGLWDGGARKLFLVRDRMGIKPLYYTLQDGDLLFASELKALMAFPQFRRDLDLDALALFLHYQYVPAPRAIFRNTWKLLPGHYAVVDGQGVTTRPYWSLPPLEEVLPAAGPWDEEVVLERLEGLLSQAVEDRLVSDVPVGALLSGGIDSSLVTALMRKAHGGPVKTFSIGFTEEAYDEAPHARAIAEHLHTEHTEFHVTPADSLEVIPRLPEIYDEPFADSSAIPTTLVSRLARSQVTVALSGDGGDEQFAGYVRYWSTASLDGALKRLPLPLRRLLSRGLQRLPLPWIEAPYGRIRPFLPQHLRVANFPDKWQKAVALLDRPDLEELYRMTICLWPREEIFALLGREVQAGLYEETFAETDRAPLLARFMRVDQRTYLPDAMLTKVDRASMTVGLEVRVPLLDHRVVAFTAGIPDHLKYSGGESKVLLRRLLSRHVPPRLYERPKMGFGVPMEQWLRRDLKHLLTDYLSPERLRREGLFAPAEVTRKVEAHLKGVANHQYRLWALLMWEMWRERWLP